MFALTLYPEWAWAVVALGKDVENRTWALPPVYLNRPIAIHAGAHLDGDLRDRRDEVALRRVAHTATLAGWHYELDGVRGPILRRDGVVVVASPRVVVRSAVVAVARISACVQGARSGWAVHGQYQWMLSDVHPLPRPLPCRGMPGVWELPVEVAAEIQHQVVEVSRAS